MEQNVQTSSTPTLTPEPKVKKYLWNKHPRIWFWGRMVLWLTASVAGPIIAASHYGVLVITTTTSTITSTSLTSLGILFVILLPALIVLRTLKYIRKSYPKNSYGSQIFKGFWHVSIPMLIILGILYFLMKNPKAIETMFWIIFWTTICETVAIPINPLPQWCFKRNLEYSGPIDILTDYAKKIYNALNRRP